MEFARQSDVMYSLLDGADEARGERKSGTCFLRSSYWNGL